MMLMWKNVPAIIAAVERRLDKDMFTLDPSYPITISIGLPGRATLEANAVAVHDNNRAVLAWAQSHGCSVATETRVIGTPVSLVTKIIVPDERTALRIVKRDLAAQYRQSRKRYTQIREAFPLEPQTAMRIVAMLSNESDVNVELILDVARYLSLHDTHGKRPREIPLAGFSAKWLDKKRTKRRKTVELLSAKTLKLVERPCELRFRYLDPNRLPTPDFIATEPWFDGPLLGIRYVVIVENKDTYQAMPPITNGLCVFGNGHAAAAGLSLLPWLFDESIPGLRVVYWGDMDAAGFEILSSIRQTGLNCDSILMNHAAFAQYGRFGTSHDQDDKPLKRQEPQLLPGLRPDERELYEALCTGTGVVHLRLEQERIPIKDAAIELAHLGFPVQMESILSRQ